MIPTSLTVSPDVAAPTAKKRPAPRVAMITSLIAITFLARSLFGQAFCAPPKKMPDDPPQDSQSPVCQPKKCNKCSASPCYVNSGIYVTDAVDLTIPTNGFPLDLSRHYDSSVTVDGPMGIGWTSSVTPHLYYATYYYAPNVYYYNAVMIMPDGAKFQFVGNANGTFAPPAGRYDTLVRNANGTFTMTLQRSRAVYSFGSDGALTNMADDFGNTLAFSYNANGQIQTVTDLSGSGRSLTVVWNPQGRIADVSDSSSPARHFVYTYNADGTLAGVRDPVTPSGNQSTRYSYLPGRYGPVLSEIDDRWGRVITRLAWQADGKLASYTDGDFNEINPSASTGEKYTYAYNSGFTYKYSSLGSLSHTYAPGGLITDHAQYDGNGNTTSTFDGTNLWQIGYQYNSRGNVTLETKFLSDDATRACCPVPGNWIYTYDTNYPDQIASVTPMTPDGHPLTNYSAWLYEYNQPTEAAPGALKRVKRYNSSRTTTETMMTYAYDAKGHVLSETDNLGHVSTFTYDTAGNVTSTTIGGVLTTFTYDSVGRRLSKTDAIGHTTTYTYDALDRVLTVTLPPPSSSQVLSFVTTYSYGDSLENGLVFVSVTDPNGHVARNGYDALGHLVRAVDALGNATLFTYQYNVLKSVTDANGNVTSYTYDVNRNPTSTTFPDGATESYVTGWDGTMRSVTDRKGITRTYQYDSLGRIWSVTYASGGTTLGSVDYSYTGETLTSVSYGPPTQRATTSYTYDSFWRLATESENGYKITHIASAAYVSGTSGYTIAPETGQTGPTYTVSYGYDSNQRITSILSTALAGASFGIEYEPLGQYSRITFPNGQTREFSYDAQGRIITLANRTALNNIATFQYGYDYDATGAPTLLGQRTSVTSSGPATANSVTRYAYDANYQLVSQTEGSVVRSWQYDAIGNRVFAQYPWTFYHNGSNPLNGQRLRSDGGADFTYDANGNMTGRVGQSLYTWDYADRLAASLSSNLSYSYDYLNRRTSTNWGGQVTKYVSLGMHTLAERAGTTNRDYVFAPGIDEPLAMVENGVARYYAGDGLGSVVATTDSSASVLSAASYDAWGVATNLGFPNSNGLFGYTGRESDGFGLMFNRARWYVPQLGRFLSEDPLARADFQIGGKVIGNLLFRMLYKDLNATLRSYQYTNNAPIQFADPMGLEISGEWLCGGSAIFAMPRQMPPLNQWTCLYDIVCGRIWQFRPGPPGLDSLYLGAVGYISPPGCPCKKYCVFAYWGPRPSVALDEGYAHAAVCTD